MNLVSLPTPPEAVPDGWRPSTLFEGTWLRGVGPPLDVPIRLGEARALLQVVEEEAGLWLGDVREYATEDGVRVLTRLRAPDESLADACEALERAFCGARVGPALGRRP